MTVLFVCECCFGSVDADEHPTDLERLEHDDLRCQGCVQNCSGSSCSLDD